MRSSVTPQVATSHGCSVVSYCSTALSRALSLPVVVTVVSFFQGSLYAAYHLQSLFISSFQNMILFYLYINFIAIAGA